VLILWRATRIHAIVSRVSREMGVTVSIFYFSRGASAFMLEPHSNHRTE
jgi:hypothetical protein